MQDENLEITLNDSLREVGLLLYFQLFSINLVYRSFIKSPIGTLMVQSFTMFVKPTHLRCI